MYRFKIYYQDGNKEISGGCAIRPTALYNDFDGLLEWNEFENLREKDMTTKKY